MRADYAANRGEPATFFAFGVERVLGAPTNFDGVVLNNARQPIEGATVELILARNAFQTTSDAEGRFSYEDLPLFGPGFLHVEGATATAVNGVSVPFGSFPALEFRTVVTQSADNSLSDPVLLPRLEEGILFDNVKDGVLSIDGVDGLQMVVKAQSMTLEDGTVPDPVNPVFISLSQVHHDDIPMPMPNSVIVVGSGTVVGPGSGGGGVPCDAVSSRRILSPGCGAGAPTQPSGGLRGPWSHQPTPPRKRQPVVRAGV